MVLVHDTLFLLLFFFNTCMKFYKNNLNGCQLTERTRNREITINIQSRVMVVVHDTSSYCA